jgi:hypothetical protein
MLCTKYDELGYFDKITFIGELVHACQSDNNSFDQAQQIIKIAKSNGYFNGVQILPDHLKPEQNEAIE